MILIFSYGKRTILNTTQSFWNPSSVRCRSKLREISSGRHPTFNNLRVELEQEKGEKEALHNEVEGKNVEIQHLHKEVLDKEVAEHEARTKTDKLDSDLVFERSQKLQDSLRMMIKACKKKNRKWSS